MSKKIIKEMSLAINDAELAIGNFVEIVELWECAGDGSDVKVNLGKLRQLVNCYPALNKIVNDPKFTCK